jgi:uncharacterized protein
MNIELCWRALRWSALEHLHFSDSGREIRADGLITGSFDGAPLRLEYRVVCDPTWRTTAFRVADLTNDQQIDLEHPPGEGWRDATGASRPELAAAIDVDLAATPFTNTLPIRRLGLSPGQTVELTVVYIAVTPELSFRTSRQRYTRLPGDARSDRYVYESLESEFKRELVVDSHGFVIDYPCVWSRAER